MTFELILGFPDRKELNMKFSFAQAILAILLFTANFLSCQRGRSPAESSELKSVTAEDNKSKSEKFHVRYLKETLSPMASDSRRIHLIHVFSNKLSLSGKGMGYEMRCLECLEGKFVKFPGDTRRHPIDWGRWNYGEPNGENELKFRWGMLNYPLFVEASFSEEWVGREVVLRTVRELKVIKLAPVPNFIPFDFEPRAEEFVRVMP